MANINRIELEGHITLLVSGDRISLRIEDKNAGIRLVDMELTPDDFCKLLGRRACIPCKMLVADPRLIGKYEVMRNIELPMGKDASYGTKRLDIAMTALKKLPEVVKDGWHPSTYFGSQDSFFSKEIDGKRGYYARTHLTKWVSREEAEEFKAREGYNVPALNERY